MENTIKMLKHYLELAETGRLKPDVILIHNGQMVNDWWTVGGRATWCGLSYDQIESILLRELENVRQHRQANAA